MNTPPSLLIQYDPATWKPTAVLLNGETDIETAKLQEMVDRMLRNVERPENEN